MSRPSDQALESREAPVQRMLFNSWVFLGFFAVTYSGYLLLARRLELQNLWLLAASLVFYGYWDPRFLLLLGASILANFWLAQRIEREALARAGHRWLVVSVVLNLGVLGFFKYANFFADSVIRLLAALGAPASPATLDVLLPIGISFYTFQVLGYLVDIQRGEAVATRNLAHFALFKMFFPQLVAGPIERAKQLLVQVAAPRTVTWSKVHAGLFLIVWGYFKKLVIADNLALVANEVFDGYAGFRGLDLLIGALAFSVQIYCDFSGYSDIARGLSKLMGFELMVNFKLPYFALSPSDFWRRWHISLSTWLRDYLYVPLGGNRRGGLFTYRNLMLTMTLGGLWHGAAWNFVAWGLYHGLLLVLYRGIGELWPQSWSLPPSTLGERLLTAARMTLMFAFTVVGWVLFRSSSLAQIQGMLSGVGFSWSERSPDLLHSLCFFSAPLLVVQVLQHRTRDLSIVARLPAWALGPLYALMIAGVVVLGVRESIEFIYFQF